MFDPYSTLSFYNTGKVEGRYELAKEIELMIDSPTDSYHSKLNKILAVIEDVERDMAEEMNVEIDLITGDRVDRKVRGIF